MTKRRGPGWFDMPDEHALASKGIKTKLKSQGIPFEEFENQLEIFVQWGDNLTPEQREIYYSAVLYALDLGWREQKEIEDMLNSINSIQEREQMLIYYSWVIEQEDLPVYYQEHPDWELDEEFHEQLPIWQSWGMNLVREDEMKFIKSTIYAISLGWREQQEIEKILKAIDTKDKKREFKMRFEPFKMS